MNNDISLAVYDAWLVSPPCEKNNDPYCSCQCPYYGACTLTMNDVCEDEELEVED